MHFQSASIGLNGKGSCIKIGDSVDIRAGGADIWGKQDELMFYFMERSGDFTLISRLESFELTDLYSKAGLMARETLDPKSPHVIFAAFPSNDKRNKNNGGYEFQYRTSAGKNSFAVYPSDYTKEPPLYPVNYPNSWLKLVRQDDTFFCYCGTNGIDWTLYCRYDSQLPKNVFIGLAVTAHSKKKMTLAKFSNIIVE